MTKRTTVGLALLAIALLGGISAILWKEARKAVPPDLAADPARNEAYASYEYGEPDTIYIGTQPLYSPTGLITEAMRHDRVLEEDLQKIGLKIEFRPYFKGYDVNHFLSRGRLQAGIGGDMPTLTIAAAGAVVIAVKVQDGPVWLVSERTIFLKDLKGKRIGYALGSNAHFTLLSLLSSVGLSEEDVRLVPMPVSEMPGAMAKGTIAAFAAWEPTPRIAEVKYGFVHSFGAQSSGYMYFRRDFADERPEALRKVVAAAARAIQWLRANKTNRLRASEWNMKTAEVLTNKADPLSKEENTFIAERDLLQPGSTVTYRISKEELSQDGRLGKKFSFLKEIGKLPAEVPWETVRDSFDETILDEILRKPRAYSVGKSRYVSEPAE